MAMGRFGVRLPVAGVLANPASIERVALGAERLGFDSLWVHDYLIWTKKLDRLHISCGSREAVDAAGEDYPPVFFESLTNLAYLAAVTRRIRLGVAVLCLPYREPVLTARQIACIDQLSGGRLELGIGPGAPKSTHNEDPEVLGIDRVTKYDNTREHFEAMRAIWTEPAPEFHGRFVDFGAATVYPKPLQQPYPPVWVGGSQEKSLEMVADYATGWLPNWLTPATYPKAIADVHRRLVERGRDPDELTVGTEIQICIADSREAARKAAERTMDVFQEGYVATPGFAAGSSRLDTIWGSSLIDSVENVSDQIAAYVEAGCTFFELKFIYHTVDHLLDQLATFSERIAPRFA